MSKRKHKMKFDIFQKRFKKVDNTNGWPEGCTDKWNQLKVNKTELETFFQKLGFSKQHNTDSTNFLGTN